jgi:carboxylesterase type B
VEGITQSEDCLFLDVFVPGWIVRGPNIKDERVAVVHWIFGGGFGLKALTYLTDR